QHLTPVPEDSSQCWSYEQHISNRTRKPQRRCVVDAIFHESAVSVWLEMMLVPPAMIGSHFLRISEQTRWLPLLDTGSPSKRNGSQVYRILNPQAGAEFMGQLAENRKPHSSRRHHSDIWRLGKKAKNFLDMRLHPGLVRQYVARPTA